MTALLIPGPAISPVLSFYNELADALEANPDFMAMVPGGVYRHVLTPFTAARYPLIFAPASANPTDPRVSFQANVVVLPQQRVAAPLSPWGVDLYSRIEVRAARNDAGRFQIGVILDAIDRLDGATLPVRRFHGVLDVLGQPVSPPFDDEASDLALYAFTDIRMRLVLLSANPTQES